MTMTEIETPQAVSVQDSTMFVEDMRAFTRINRASRAAWRDGENPLAGYFTTDETFTMRKFGLEIEFNSPDIMVPDEDSYDDGYGCECSCECVDDAGNYADCDGECCSCGELGDEARTPVAEWLCAQGYIDTPRGAGYHSGEELYDIWRYEADCSVTGGEVITPVMEGNGASWSKIESVMHNIAYLGGEADGRNCGGHISINVSDLNHDAIARLGRLVAKFEDVMYRLATNPFRANDGGSRGVSRHRGMSYAGAFRETVMSRFSDTLNYDNVALSLNRGYWLNYVSYHNRLEFRIFDGTLDPATAQTFAMIASAFVDVAKNVNHVDITRNVDVDAILDEMPNRPLGWHVIQRREAGFQARTALSGEAWEKDTLAIRQFVDLLFDNTQEKERVITLFAAHDWNQRGRY